jgi:hypothetical protein
MVPADPSLLTKKEFQDICGVDFDKDLLSKRLERTNFLYPRHVEVIEDIAPIAGDMVGEIVSGQSSISGKMCGHRIVSH